jgi:hypothetical protein
LQRYLIRTVYRKHLPGIVDLAINHNAGDRAQKMIGISLALSLAIILTQSSHPLCQHSLQQKSQENNISRMKALALTQISEFFSLPPLALFRSRIQVAFISQTARVSSAAAAPGTDFQSKLSPGESQHLS